MRSVLLLVTLVALTGCFTTSLNAPANTSVRIMAEKEKAAFQKEYKDWYILGGLVPLYRRNIAKLIEEEKLVEVRVRTEDRISDGLITVITDIVFPLFPQTVVIEGNTAEQINQARGPLAGGNKP